MTKIEKAVKIVSDLYDFYRQIPKIPQRHLVKEEERDKKHTPQGKKKDD
jgi:hypothetical protein